MKTIILLSNFLLLFSFLGYTQETDILSNVSPIKKGVIILNDGTKMNFRELKVVDDAVVFKNSQSIENRHTADEIYKISKTGNYAGWGAVSCGLGWMLGAISGTSEWDNYPDLKAKKSTFIWGGTAACAAFGALIGALIKKDKTIYKNQTSFSFYPVLKYNKDKHVNFMLSCKININSK